MTDSARPPRDPVAETMLITLWARAAETARPDAIIRDHMAAHLVKTIDYDFSRFRRGWKSQIGVAVRAQRLDERVRTFTARHENAVVVTLGAGLDTRGHRLASEPATWVHVDLPEVIDLRRRLLPPCPRQIDVACSIFDDAWRDVVNDLRPSRVLVIAEGVLMFCPLADVRRLVDVVARAYPGGEMHMDTIGPLMVHFPGLHDTLPMLDARFTWGLREPQTIDAWSEHCALQGAESMLAHAPRRWRWMRWLGRIPGFRHQFALLHLAFRPPPGAASAV